MNNIKTINLSKNQQQLVDLNENLTNFELIYYVKSQSLTPFYIAVATQDILDYQTAEFQLVNGQHKGNIIYNKNIYKNFFLLLKSQENNILNVIIEKREVAPEIPEKHPVIQEETPRVLNHKKHVSFEKNDSEDQMVERLNQSEDKREKKEGTEWLKTFGIVFVLCIISVLLYRYIFSKSSSHPKLVDKINNTLA